MRFRASGATWLREGSGPKTARSSPQSAPLSAGAGRPVRSKLWEPETPFAIHAAARAALQHSEYTNRTLQSPLALVVRRMHRKRRPNPRRSAASKQRSDFGSSASGVASCLDFALYAPGKQWTESHLGEIVSHRASAWKICASAELYIAWSCP